MSDNVETDSHVLFEGPGPFHLPTAQRTGVVGHRNNGVTAIFYCLASIRVRGVEQSRGLEPVNVQMASKVARELAAQLLRAADESDRQGQERQ
jgi:hypothetical protein